MAPNLLLIDVGNTHLKVAIARAQKEFIQFALPTYLDETPDSLGLKLEQIMAKCGQPNLDAWVVCSVVPGLNSVLREAAKNYGNCPIYFVPEDLELDIVNCYARPQEVGADRLVGAYAARKLFAQRSIIVVDLGTATTFDCICDNSYLGGLICPGIISSLKALSTQTAKLPQISLNLSSDQLLIGQSTSQSLEQGFVFGFAAMIDGLCQRLKSILQPEVLVVATGGLAKIMAKISSEINIVYPELLMEGLRLSFLNHKPRRK